MKRTLIAMLVLALSAPGCFWPKSQPPVIYKVYIQEPVSRDTRSTPTRRKKTIFYRDNFGYLRSKTIEEAE